MKGRKKSMLNNTIIKRFLLQVFYFILKILGIILLAIAMRVFLFASFKIPSPSMEPALLPGDYILVNKMIPGPRIFKNMNIFEGGKIEFNRLKGIRAVKRNDILVFNYPYSDWNKLALDYNVYYVKRCIAIPGDTFLIDNGIYKIKNRSDTLGCYENQYRLSQLPDERFPKQVFRCFPKDSLYHWTVKNFGPLYVPKAGETLQINRQTIPLYRKLIEYETEQKVSIRDSLIFLDDKRIEDYTFSRNYYFMSGDYVNDSKDSRYWGLLPEDHIVGKAAIVWKSKNEDTDQYRFKRFFKRIQ